nr:rho GTPase-activating protein gacU-like [Dermatophagoides farinae]
MKSLSTTLLSSFSQQQQSRSSLLLLSSSLIFTITSLPLQLWKTCASINSTKTLFSYSIIMKIISVLIMLMHYMECNSIPPYRHGLARYYQPQSPPPSVNTYQIPSTFTSYSITLPVHPSPINIERNIPNGPYQQSYYQPPPKYQPQPQYCPETGRTVCSKVPYYPSDEVFSVVKMARAKRFNISSEFVDESENDSEPYFEDDFGEEYGDTYPSYPYSEPYDRQPSPPPPPSPGQQYQYQQQQQQQQQQPYRSQQYRYRMNSVTINHEQPQQHPSVVQHYHNLDWKYFRNMMSRNVFPVIQNNPRSIGDISIPNGLTGTTTPIINRNSRTFDTNDQIHGSVKSMYSPNGDQSFSTNHFNNNNHNGGRNGARGHSRYKRQADEAPISIEPLCPSRTILLEPKAALNDRRQWKYVVNLADRDRRLRQAIKVEVCMTPNAPCSNQISLPFGFVSRCRQKYIKKKLISLDESGQSISSENFFAPSCCVCEVSRGNPSIPPTSVPSTPGNLATSATGSSVSIQTESSLRRFDDSATITSKRKKHKHTFSTEKFDIDRPQADAPIIIPQTTKQTDIENRKTRNNHVINQPNDNNIVTGGIKT